MYKIVKETDLERFVNSVNSSIKEGWECLGGISVIMPSPLGVITYYQAMRQKP